MAGIAGKLPCPSCGADGQSEVVLSRQATGGTLRRHRCRCGHRWWTLQPPPVALESWRVRWSDKEATVLPTP